MKRREAIQSLTVVSAGLMIMPSCNGEQLPVYENLLFDKKHRLILTELSEAILPKENLPVTTPETTIDFILTMLNDCYAPEDLEKYTSGFNECVLHLKQNFGQPVRKLNETKRNELFQYLAGDEATEEMQYFFKTTRGLTLRHFTSSEYFLTTFLDYEFAPGRYHGCVEIQ
jgi:hypothetical protein